MRADQNDCRVTLTKLGIDRVGAKETRFEIADAKVIGLRLVVQPSGFKSWCVRFTFLGRDRKLTLGPYPRVDLDQARNLGAAALRDVATGKDPATEKIETRRRQQAGLDSENLFKPVFEDYRRDHLEANLRPSTSRELKRLFEKHVLPKWKARKLPDIADTDVIAILNVLKRRAPFSANRLRAALSHFFNWCIHERRLLKISPIATVKKPHKKETKRKRRLSHSEIRWLWRACDKIGYPFGPITKLLLLTGARRDEVRAMRDAELHLEDRSWKLPGQRTKNKVDHKVFLAGVTKRILEKLPRIETEEGFVFSTNGKTAPSGFSRAKERLDRLMLSYAKEEARRSGNDPAKVEIEEWRLHDLRRTMASEMARLGIPLPVTERCLNHVGESFGGIAGVYQLHDFETEMQDAFEKWARHVETLVAASGNVIPIVTGKTRVANRRSENKPVNALVLSR
jgi:integrase